MEINGEGRMRLIYKVIGYGIIGLSGLSFVWIWFGNIHLTQGEMLLEFWKYYVSGLIIMMIGYWMVNHGTKL